jgi:hypothetical protein
MLVKVSVRVILLPLLLSDELNELYFSITNWAFVVRNTQNDTMQIYLHLVVDLRPQKIIKKMIKLMINQDVLLRTHMTQVRRQINDD